jgi:hypothetical protein
MKNLFCALALVAAGLGTGCSSPCDALTDICNKCKDDATKQSCLDAVNVYKAEPSPVGSMACQAAIDGKSFPTCQ